jgi:lipid II:glycine glycyltransferase (peptidoglycan interpeptide bridge formation enzyme)
MKYDNLVARRVNSAEKWQSLLAQLPYAHPLQSWAWGELKSRWGWEMRPTAFMVGEEIKAAAMLLYRPISYTGFGMLYAPKGPVLDYSDLFLRRTVLQRLQSIAHADRAVLLKIDPDVAMAFGAEEPSPHQLGTDLIDELRAHGWRFSPEQIQFRNTVMLDLTQTEAEILGQMKQKTRYNIRLAGRRDVTIRSGSPADFAMLVEMYEETGERNEFGIRPKSYYLDVWQTFWDADMLHILIAEYAGQPLAAVLLVHSADVCLYMYGASNSVERKRMPTYLLQWEAIQWAKAQGIPRYDFWGAPDEFNEEDRMWGVWKFKSGFNATVARHVGAWDYPAYPRLYRLMTEMLPRYRDFLRR